MSIDIKRFSEEKMIVLNEALKNYANQAIFEIPEGFALHFDPSAGSIQLVDRKANKMFGHEGGYYFAREEDS